MADDRSRWLVETDWLASHLDAPGLVVLDGSMHLPTAKRDAKAEYLARAHPRRAVLRHRRHRRQNLAAAAHAALGRASSPAA